MILELVVKPGIATVLSLFATILVMQYKHQHNRKEEINTILKIMIQSSGVLKTSFINSKQKLHQFYPSFSALYWGQ